MQLRPKVYVAAPLFSAAEREFNLQLAGALSESTTVFLPQRDGCIITDLISGGMSVEAAIRAVFEADLAAIRASDLMLAVLDGRTVDEGVALELGVAYTLGIKIWGLKTDFRSLASFGDNPMVQAVLDRTFSTVADLVCAFHDECRAGSHGARF